MVKLKNMVLWGKMKTLYSTQKKQLSTKHLVCRKPFLDILFIKFVKILWNDKFFPLRSVKYLQLWVKMIDVIEKNFDDNHKALNNY